MATSVQTTYSSAIGKAYAGLFRDDNPKEIVSLIAEGGVIPFGRAVQPGTNDQQAVIGTTTATSSYIGIAGRMHNNENVSAGTASAQYADEQVMAVMRSGYVTIDLINTGAKGSAIYSVDADGTIGAGTAAAGQTQIPGGTLEETITAAGLALIRLASE